MIPFLLTAFANKTVRKYSLYALIAVAGLMALRYHDNSVYNKGRQEGVTTGVKEALAQAEINWKEQIDALQKKIDDSHVVVAQAQKKSSVATANIDAAVEHTAVSRAKNAQDVAKIPESDVVPAIVANDATVTAENTNRKFLEAQLNVQQLDDEVKEILKNHNQYVEQTDVQIGALKDEIQATRGELTVMTAERDQYKSALASATKKRGCGLFKKIITVGLCR